jgi:hypothetical protein
MSGEIACGGSSRQVTIVACWPPSVSIAAHALVTRAKDHSRPAIRVLVPAPVIWLPGRGVADVSVRGDENIV